MLGNYDGIGGCLVMESLYITCFFCMLGYKLEQENGSGVSFNRKQGALAITWQLSIKKIKRPS